MLWVTVSSSPEFLLHPILALAIDSAPHIGDGEVRLKIYCYRERVAAMVLGLFVFQTKN